LPRVRSLGLGVTMIFRGEPLAAGDLEPAAI